MYLADICRRIKESYLVCKITMPTFDWSDYEFLTARLPVFHTKTTPRIHVNVDQSEMLPSCQNVHLTPSLAEVRILTAGAVI